MGTRGRAQRGSEASTSKGVEPGCRLQLSSGQPASGPRGLQCGLISGDRRWHVSAVHTTTHASTHLPTFQTRASPAGAAAGSAGKADTGAQLLEAPRGEAASSVGGVCLSFDRRLMQEAGTKRSMWWARGPGLSSASPRPPSEPQGAGLGLHPHRLGWEPWSIRGSRGSQVLGLYVQPTLGGDLSHSSLSSCPGAGPPHRDSGLPRPGSASGSPSASARACQSDA